MAVCSCYRVDKVRAIRNAWQPMFYTGSLENFVGLMHDAAAKAVQRLSVAVNSKEAINAHTVLSAMTIQVIAAAAFGQAPLKLCLTAQMLTRL